MIQARRASHVDDVEDVVNYCDVVKVVVDGVNENHVVVVVVVAVVEIVIPVDYLTMTDVAYDDHHDQDEVGRDGRHRARHRRSLRLDDAYPLLLQLQLPLKRLPQRHLSNYPLPSPYCYPPTKPVSDSPWGASVEKDNSNGKRLHPKGKVSSAD